MPHTRKDEAPVQMDEPVITGRYVDLDGYTVAFESYHADVDPAPFFQGLPDDRCQCPHWGYVLSGELRISYADRGESFKAGDAYYVPPGHLPVVTAGTEIVEFSPTEALQQTMAVVGANMQAAIAGASSCPPTRTVATRWPRNSSRSSSPVRRPTGCSPPTPSVTSPCRP